MIKKKKLLRTSVIGAAVLFVSCFATATQANTIYVGGCHTGGYATITIALSHATPGTIIDVCPGYYAEQVTITMDNITLQGIASTQSGKVSDSAVIVSPTLASPAAAWVQNGTLYSPDDPTTTAAQIAVVGATGVVISHITVDAANNGYDCGAGNLIGIYYQNSTGTITDSVARNQSVGNGDQCGWGIGTESNSGAPLLTVTNTSVHGFQKNGIAARGTGPGVGPELTAMGNTVIGAGATSTLPGQNGIEVAFGATGTVKSNYVADLLYTPSGAATGILLYGSGASTVQANAVESANTGIGVDYDGSGGFNTGGGSDVTISGNHIGEARCSTESIFAATPILPKQTSSTTAPIPAFTWTIRAAVRVEATKQ